MFQFTGATDNDKWAGPFPTLLFRSWEAMGSVAAQICSFPTAVAETTDLDWIFVCGPIAAAAGTKNIHLHTFTRSTRTFAYVGYITCTFQDAGNYTPQAMKASLDFYTTGTAAVNGVNVTGTATTWVSSRIPLGCRIQFGSTTPNPLGTWYEIATIGGAETAMTLTAAAGIIADGPYVIEDLRIYMTMINATAALGGLFMVKGIKRELFTLGGTAVASSVNTDGVRGTYFLKDAAVGTNSTPYGLGVAVRTSWTNQEVFVYDQAVLNATMFRYNTRAALAALVAGRESGSTLVAKTGIIAVVGALRAQSSVMTDPVTALHGPGTGVPCLYFSTATRLYRVIIANVVAAGVGWIGDYMLQTGLQPGGGTTFVDPGLYSPVYLPGCDRFLNLTGLPVNTGKHFFTEYKIDGSQWDRIFLYNDGHLEQTTTDVNVHPHTQGPPFGTAPTTPMTGCTLNGLCYVQMPLAATLGGHLHIFSFDGDWDGAYLITPRLMTPGCASFNKAYHNVIRSIGATIGGTFSTGTDLASKQFGISTEPIRIYYRTDATEILNNTGVWQGPLGSIKDLSAVAPAAQIQFKIGFRTCSAFGTSMPARLLLMGVTYNDGVGDAHYQPSATWSDRVNKRFAWRFASAFGGAVPALYVRIYDAITLALVNTDNTTAPTGTWEKSVDGGANWIAWTNADKANDITYLRWTPAVMADNFIAKATLNLS
jgi:hypothetical protein